MAGDDSSFLMIKIYRNPALSPPVQEALLEWVQTNVDKDVTGIATEACFYVQLKSPALTETEQSRLHWLLSETFEQEMSKSTSFLSECDVEVGPRLNFSTAWCTNAVAICHACGLDRIVRIERSRRYKLSGSVLSDQAKQCFISQIHDRMTEQIYQMPLESFCSTGSTGSITTPEPVCIIPIMSEGRKALDKINQLKGFGFDDWDLDYYTNLFQNQLGRDPTDVECFDLAQSNSEHSRHWFFGGKLLLDGKTMPKTLFQMVKETLTTDAKRNSVIAFHDNSSVIQGHAIRTLKPQTVGTSSWMELAQSETTHVLLTAETHNFPTGVAPYAGAETGTGGRIRDVQATGRGAHVMAGVSAYSVGNLHLPEYDLPWEDKSFLYPTEKMATPLDIEIEASNGASAYGNKFGEPVVTGFTRSFGLRLPCGERREYVKPIMFSAGVGQIAASHCDKGEAQDGLWVVKVGGPAYRIGMGGGAASSRVEKPTDVDANHLAELDFNAVQRGDAEMENKMNRVIRACVELGDRNPIVSIHDQGAGGNGNVLKEIVEPTKNVKGGARYDVRKILIADETLSVLEIWGAEYQENNALLIRGSDLDLFRQICHREKSPFCALGQVTGDGVVVLFDSKDNSTPVNLPLSLVLADMPQKCFTDTKRLAKRLELQLPQELTVETALDRVLRLLSVASKRFLTTKVDRSVTGLIAQQQCVGPLHIPLADVAVVAQSHFPNDGSSVITGVATACGEQPIKGLVDAAAMARLSVGEALTNLVWAKISALDDCKCSANWMWAAKLNGEACEMYRACEAMRDVMLELGVSIDGGKDSLSMSTQVAEDHVKAPGTLVITMYAPCPDIEKIVTPDLKPQLDSVLLYVDLGAGHHRLGGTALAQVYSQIGNQVPDVSDAKLLRGAFMATQKAIASDLILAGHDRSDGGLITTILEMAFAGNSGLDVDFSNVQVDPIQLLFSEELGLVLQVAEENIQKVMEIYQVFGVPCAFIGRPASDLEKSIRIRVDSEVVLHETMFNLRDTWEATGFQLERRQANPACVAQEEISLRTRSTGPEWKLTFEPNLTSPEWLLESSRSVHRVAVIREEGSNGDREMQSAFYSAGFQVWDVTMTDLVSGKVSLDRFRGIAFVGGFSYADVLGSAKGWAAVAKFHPSVWKELQQFKARPDTFSLGVCNGCQLMALLGWVSPTQETMTDARLPRFIENTSGRYESRFVSVMIEQSPAVLLRGMEGSSLGVWVAHGEGRAYFPEEKDLELVQKNKLIPMRYVDDTNRPTESYPFNPNGSPFGIAGLCSTDGRHLCMMPHPERCFLKWQWPWLPTAWKTLNASPWLRMFQNAKDFCVKS